MLYIYRHKLQAEQVYVLRSTSERRVKICQEWPPFSGPKIYLSVYLFILKYMNHPCFPTPPCIDDQLSFNRVRKITFYSFTISKQYPIRLRKALYICSVENIGYILRVKYFILTAEIYDWVPFSSCPWIWMGWDFGRTSVPKSVPTCPPHTREEEASPVPLLAVYFCP